jgi:hypothetical protein
MWRLVCRLGLMPKVAGRANPNPSRHTHLGRLMPFRYRMTLPVSGLRHLPVVVVTGLPQTYTAYQVAAASHTASQTYVQNAACKLTSERTCSSFWMTLSAVVCALQCTHATVTLPGSRLKQ